MIPLTILLVMANLFSSEHEEFFDLANEQAKKGLAWQYVGPQDIDPAAKSISLKDAEGKKYIIWKLKK